MASMGVRHCVTRAQQSVARTACQRHIAPIACQLAGAKRWSIETRISPHHDLRPSLSSVPSTRHHFSSTSKWEGKGARKVAKAAAAKEEHISPDDPSDFEQVKADLAQVIADLKKHLGSLKGTITAETVEDIRVVDTRSERTRHRLGTVAHVIPKGRQMEIIVDDKDYVRNVISGIASSKYNLNPQTDPQQPNKITVMVPPMTAESRKAMYDEAHQAGHAANRGVTAARATQQKRLRQMQLKHLARPDDIRKAQSTMNDLCSEANEQAKKLTEEAKKVWS